MLIVVDINQTQIINIIIINIITVNINFIVLLPLKSKVKLFSLGDYRNLRLKTSRFVVTASETLTQTPNDLVYKE